VIERTDWSFREVRENELLELAQKAWAAKNFWLFIFKPNNLLLAYKNESIASVM